MSEQTVDTITYLANIDLVRALIEIGREIQVAAFEQSRPFPGTAPYAGLCGGYYQELEDALKPFEDVVYE